MSETTRISIRVPTAHKDQLRALAQARGVAVNDIINAGITLLVEERPPATFQAPPTEILAALEALGARLVRLEVTLHTFIRVYLSMTPAIAEEDTLLYAQRGQQRMEKFLGLYDEDLAAVQRGGVRP